MTPRAEWQQRHRRREARKLILLRRERRLIDAGFTVEQARAMAAAGIGIRLVPLTEVLGAE